MTPVPMVFNQIRYRARLVKRFEPVPMIAAYPGRIAQGAGQPADQRRGGHRRGAPTRSTGSWLRPAWKAITWSSGVSDTGTGVHEDNRERIFTPGFTTKAHEGGMGLGLTACKSVAKEHGGRLEVHHLPDGGTRFELILPADTGLTAIERRKDSHPVSEAPLKRSRILIVDDDAMVLSALRRRLRRRYDTVTVLGGVEALARLSEDPGFDSIVCVTL